MRRKSIWLSFMVIAFGIYLGGCADKTFSPSHREPDSISRSLETPVAVAQKDQPKLSPGLRGKFKPDSIDEKLETPLAVAPQEKMKAYPSPGEYVAFSLKVAEHMISEVGDGKDYRAMYQEVFNLGGINKIYGLVYDPEKKEMILVGQYDPKRQAITLDDFVVALKARFIHGTWPVVSLDPTHNSPTTGMQNVRFEGGIEDTQFGADLLDADHRLKRMAFGLLPTGVLGLKSSFDFRMKQLTDNPASKIQFAINSRFWFYPVLSSVSVRQDVVAMKGLQVGVFTEVLSAENQGERITDLEKYKDAANDWFAQEVSTRFKELGLVHPSFSRVQGLDELVALTKGIEQMEKRPDFDWWFEEYKIKKVQTPREVKVLKRKENYTAPTSVGYLKGYSEVSGGVELMAIALRLNAGDITALKEAVLMARPSPVVLSWKFVVGEWVIPTSSGMVKMDNIAALFAQAGFLRTQKRYDSAITLYGKILDLKPDWIEVYNNRGNVYTKKGQYELAMADFNQALEINPTYATVYHNIGFLFAKKKQYNSAIANFSKAIKINPRLAETHNSRGLQYAGQGRYDFAIADFTQAINIKPQFADAYSNRGLSYTYQGKYDLALNDFNKAIELNPKDAKFYFNRGATYDKGKGQYDLAMADYNHALEINPKLVFVYNNRGAVYLRIFKDKLKACSDWSKACEIGKCRNYNLVCQ